MSFPLTFDIWDAPTFSFAPPWSQCHIIHDVSVCMDVRLLVVGDPDNASYEWVVLQRVRDVGYLKDREWQRAPNGYTDVGYGQSAIALYEGLKACEERGML